MNNTKFYAFVGSPETMATYFEVVDTTAMDEQDIDSHLDIMSYTVYRYAVASNRNIYRRAWFA